MVTAAIFDIDGTLMDSVDVHARAWQEAFKDFGFDVAFDRIRSQIGKGGDQLLPEFLSGADHERVGDALEEHRGKLFKGRYMQGLKPFDDVPALFRRVQAAGLDIALASSAKGDELEEYKRMAGIQDLVHVAASSADAERSKPYPDIFAAALARLGDPDPAEVVAIGDSPWDAIAAGKIGIRTIGMLCGGFAEADLREAGCIAVYQNPSDLLSRFDGSPLSPSPGGRT